MNPTVVVPVNPALPLPVVVHDLPSACEPLVRRHAHAEESRPVFCVGLEDGGAAMLDPRDDLSPQWAAWIECVDARTR